VKHDQIMLYMIGFGLLVGYAYKSISGELSGQAVVAGVVLGGVIYWLLDRKRKAGK
jgi:hypothetical protein